MAMWPATLPQRFLRQGFSHTAPDNRVGFQPEQGEMMTRRRGSGAPERITGAINVDVDGWNVLWTFWKDTLRHGTDKFTWVHPITAAAGATFKFDSQPTTAPASGGLLRVTLSLWILP